MKLATRLEQIAAYIRENPSPASSCQVTVATRLTDDTRSYQQMMRAINDLVRQGRLAAATIDGWVRVLSLP